MSWLSLPSLILVCLFGAACLTMAWAARRWGSTRPPASLAPQPEGPDRQAFLAAASERLAASLEYETTLATITDLAVPALGELCAIHMLTRDGATRRVAVAAVDPAARALFEELDDAYPPPADAPCGYPLAIRAGQPALESHGAHVPAAGAALGDRREELIARLGVAATLTAPLIAAEGVLGAITLAALAPGRRYGPADLELAQELARRAAQALANAQTVADLRAAVAQATAAGEARSTFLAQAAHEVRTPLVGIVGLSDLLLGTELDPWQRRLVAMLQSSATILMAATADALELVKIEAGKLELRAAPVDLLVCVEEALDLVATQAEARGLDLSYTVAPGTPPVVIGDHGRLRQVLVNLLSNAVKFTERGSVTVSVGGAPAGPRAGQWQLHLTVRDTGIGIAPEEQPRLFLPFSQLGSAAPLQAGGSGLGLAISKELCELMGGSLAVASRPGQGASFRVSLRVEARPDLQGAAPLGRDQTLAGLRLLLIGPPLPSRQALAEQAQAWGMLVQTTAPEQLATALEGQGEGYDLVITCLAPGSASPALTGLDGIPQLLLLPLGLGGAALQGEPLAVLTMPPKFTQLYAALVEHFGAGRGGPAAASSAAPDERRALRFLVAEDDEVHQLVILRLLARLGHDATLVADGAAALEALLAARFQVALLDLQLPGLGGREVAEGLIAERPAGARPYLVALSAFTTAEQRRELLAAGIDAYLGKPLTESALADLLSRVEGRLRGLDGPEQASPIDLVRLRSSLYEQTPELLEQLVSAYLGNGPQLLASLRAGLEGADPSLMARALHRLRSSSAIVTADELAELCAELEQQLATGRPEQWAAAVEAIEAAYGRVERALRGGATRASSAGE